MAPPVDWIKFFQELPDTEHELTMAVLHNGDEVAIQRILKYFDTFMVVRGRLGGTDDDGRVFCVPFNQIEFVFFTRVQTDETVVSMFGEIIGGVRRAYLTDPEEEAKKKALKEAAEAAALLAAEGGLPAGDKTAPVNVSALRSRLLNNRSKRIDPRTRQH